MGGGFIDWIRRRQQAKEVARLSLDSFKSADEAKKPYLRESILANYKRGYKYYRGNVVGYKNLKEDIEIIINKFAKYERLSMEEKAKLIGRELGFLIGSIEYAVTNQDPSHNYVVALYPRANDILSSAKKLSARLSQIGLHADKEFILKRVNKIARRYATKLTPQLQEFLAKLAAQFV